MVLNPDDCYRAIQARDARFDGTFFVGVSTTGIYCRPVCPAKTPRRDRCTFYTNPAAAEAAGYRPCLRCRPETAPGLSDVDAVDASATAIVRRIEDGALVEGSLADLARDMGLSERHLRRVVRSRFGVSPIELAQTHRLLSAKRLLTDTSLPIGEVAAASGFASLRRFNALLKERYGLSPTAFRKVSKSRPADAEVVCRVHFRPPYDWASLLRFLSDRAPQGVEAAVAGVYVRTATAKGRKGWIEVSLCPERAGLRVVVSNSLVGALPEVLVRVRRLFDLSADPAVIDDRLSPLSDATPGLRVPGAFDGFETAVRAILGQQVSVAGARTTAAVFAEAFGEAIETPHRQLSRLWPSARTVADLEPERIAEIGIIRSRAVAVTALAKAVVGKELRLAPGADVEKTKERLLAIPGVGPWTAEYVAMRCLSWPDSFMDTDLGVKKALAAMPDADPEAWRPWRSYAMMHLWKNLEKPV